MRAVFVLKCDRIGRFMAARLSTKTGCIDSLDCTAEGSTISYQFHTIPLNQDHLMVSAHLRNFTLGTSALTVFG